MNRFIAPSRTRTALENAIRVRNARLYSSPASPGTPPKGSNRTLWIATALALTATGSYIALSPASSSSSSSSSSAKEHIKSTATSTKAHVQSSAEEARERAEARDAARAPKPNPNADSEARHHKASMANEHKVRKGKFSDVVFDNHDTRHTLDPGKDFERVDGGGK